MAAWSAPKIIMKGITVGTMMINSTGNFCALETPTRTDWYDTHRQTSKDRISWAASSKGRKLQKLQQLQVAGMDDTSWCLTLLVVLLDFASRHWGTPTRWLAINNYNFGDLLVLHYCKAPGRWAPFSIPLHTSDSSNIKLLFWRTCSQRCDTWPPFASIISMSVSRVWHSEANLAKACSSRSLMSSAFSCFRFSEHRFWHNLFWKLFISLARRQPASSKRV